MNICFCHIFFAELYMGCNAALLSSFSKTCRPSHVFCVGIRMSLRTRFGADSVTKRFGIVAVLLDFFIFLVTTALLQTSSPNLKPQAEKALA